MAPARIQTIEHYQIAIVGGGIGGITLAIACERLGIGYALFETCENLAPTLGAGIGLQPNGLRILEQLGLLEEIEENTIPLTTWRHFDGKGDLLSTVNARIHFPSK